MSIMCRQSLTLWCMLLFVVSFSEMRGHSTTTDKNERNNFTVQYEIYSNVNKSDNGKAARYNTRENFTKSNDDTQDEFRANSTSDVYENSSMEYEFQPHPTKDHENGNQMPTEHRLTFMKRYNKSDFTSQELYENLTQVEDRSNSTLYELLYQDDNKRNIVPYEMCKNNTCILLCCPIGNCLIEEEYVAENYTNYLFPDVYEYVSNDPFERKLTDKKVDQIFQLAVHDPCKYGRYFLQPDIYTNDEFTLLNNGSLYLPRVDQFVEPYCLAVKHQDKYEISVCYESPEEVSGPDQENGIPGGLIVSLPFLLITFVVYTILPDLQNMHGYTLRVYVASLFVAYTFLASLQLTDQATIAEPICIALAFIVYFSFLASFFWLNVMCFNIWCIFRGFRSLQGSAKRERKKFVIYSIYAWGSASILTIICAIMDFVPSVPREFIRPEFAETRCWFNTDKARAIYFYTPMSITVICNIFMFISTATKIVHYKMDTDKKSKCHDDNNQWFNLYLKLFIVMGISWSMEIISWLFKSAPAAVWYLTDLTNTLQGLIIFIIFVWNKKIKRLLLKRFGLEDRSLFSRNSTSSGVHISNSHTCNSSEMTSLQREG